MPATTRRQASNLSDDHDDKMSVDSEPTTGQKRKSPPTNTKKQQPDAKATKTEDSGHARAGGKDPSTQQLLNFLLSADALPYCYPKDELEAAQSGKFARTYSMTPPSSFSPFEHLVIAHMLSKPLSHTLGMRSIRTLLNQPFDLVTPEKVKEAGEKRVWEALEEARTQHRQKTATYLYQMAEEYCDDETMFRLAEECNDGGAAGAIAHIKETVSGMGETGAQLFCRRIQAVDGWGDAVWPFADPKCLDSCRELGLNVQDGDELQELIERHVDWDRVGQMGLEKLVGTGREAPGSTEKVEDMDHEQRVQVEFVVFLERVIGCVLEKKVDAVKEAASAWK